MRPEEKFVASSLVRFLAGSDSVSFRDGEDPPDIYLQFPSGHVAVEISRLLPFAIGEDGTIENSTTQSAFGIYLIESCDKLIGPTLPQNLSLIVTLEVPVARPSRFRRDLLTWIGEVAGQASLGISATRSVQGSPVRIRAIPRRASGKAIVGMIANRNVSADIDFVARVALERQIRIKTGICRPLDAPIWLALLNNYWLADDNTYIAAAAQIELDHCFDKILLVAENGGVTELKVRSRSLKIGITRRRLVRRPTSGNWRSPFR